METVKLAASAAEVGGIPVARLLPRGRCRSIGAWCFLDHAGPARFAAGSAGLQIGPHPHTNLQTFTWMLAGELLHCDSLGHRQTIRPGQLNLMTAGTGPTRGIAHTEQTPPGSAELHAVQLWIALPQHLDIEPAFDHYPELPAWQEAGADFVLLNGSLHGCTAPTRCHSPLLGADVRTAAAQVLEFPAEAGWEYGVLVLAGSVAAADGTRAAADELLLPAHGQGRLVLHAEAGSHFLLLGGEPLPHPIRLWWNFVADGREALQQAVRDWNGGSPRFGAAGGWYDPVLKPLPAPETPFDLR